MKKLHLAILGTGNLGTAIAKGLYHSGEFDPGSIILTRRKINRLQDLKESGFVVQKDNSDAVRRSDIILIAVEPQQIDNLLDEIKQDIHAGKHTVISVVTGVSINQIARSIGNDVSIIRAMPNTAIAVKESVTCLAINQPDKARLEIARDIFSVVGTTINIEEEQMAAATALGACGIAFFLRAIRAASQGGIEIGFHAEKALAIAAQTAKGAATLLLKNQNHPEHEIDRVTTPRGVTISGLNQMEHGGFSSAMIKGIVTSWEKSAKIYREE